MSNTLHTATGLRPWARRLARWLLLAMMLATLAPAISRGLAGGPPQDGQDWVELCTSQGIQWVRLPNALAEPGSDPKAPATGALDLCGHCTLAGERFAPLLPPLPVVAVEDASWAVPGFQAFRPASVAALRPAARGPPFLN